MKPDVSVEAEDLRTKELLGQLTEGVRSVAVSDPDTGVTGVLVPADRYVELVARALKQKNSWIADPEGRSFPTGLADADVEQVDQASWQPVERRLR